MSAPSCDHSGHIDTDVSGRRVCADCGEVLFGQERIVEDRFDASPEFQIIPKLSTFGESVSQTTTATIDAVCDHCEKVIGSRLPNDLKQRVMQLVESYRQASGVRQLYSYENAVRTAMLVVLRSAGYTINPTQLVPRFDEKRTPMFRLLTRMQAVMGVRVEPVSVGMLVAHVVDNLLRDAGERNIYPQSFLGTPGADLMERLVHFTTIVMLACAELGSFSSSPKLSQAVACSYCVMRFGCEFPPSVGKRDFTLKTANACSYIGESDKAVYRDFDIVRSFMRDSLLQTGLRDVNERTFLENFEFIQAELRKKAEVRRRISEIVARPQPHRIHV